MVIWEEGSGLALTENILFFAQSGSHRRIHQMVILGWVRARFDHKKHMVFAQLGARHWIQWMVIWGVKVRVDGTKTYGFLQNSSPDSTDGDLSGGSGLALTVKPP